MKFISKLTGTTSALALLAVVALVLNPFCVVDAVAAGKDMVQRDRWERKLDQTLPGGYQVVSVDEGNVVEAADFAFEELQALNYSISDDPEASSDAEDYEIIRASEQVVAGLNIKLDMVFQDSLGDCVGAATVVVYDHFGDLSITSWDPIDNGCKRFDANGSDSNLAETGSYQSVSVEDDNVVTAANFAFEELESSPSDYAISDDPEASSDATDYEVTQASQQVVAGLNIKMDMVFQDSSGDCLGAATVEVYDHFGDLSITSWEPNENGCGDLLGSTATDTDSADDSSAYFSSGGISLSLIQMVVIVLLLK